MEIVHQGFDSLDVAFQGTLSRDARMALSAAKERAKQNMQSEHIVLGGVKIWVEGKGTAADQGYSYLFDTGDDGEIWAIKNNGDPMQWNIRVSVRALALARHGYEAVVQCLSLIHI